ncbi:histone H1-like [Melanotaenia boesemani]|uniref:histone H1-like n=1 Tax=Melanotaenia boesemani TaxID=1250792 RepID=UPI001C0542D8|nr:histone H1-like [Melanotaenia boesemani]
MVQTCTLPKVKEVALKVLEKIKRNDLVQKLSESGLQEASQSQEGKSTMPLPPDNGTPHVARDKKDDLPNLILHVVKDSQERQGISEPALTKALAASGFDVAHNARIQPTLVRMENAGILEKAGLIGAPFYYKMKNKKETKKNKAAPQARKTSTKKPARTKKQSAVSASSKKPDKPAAAKNSTKWANGGPKKAKQPGGAKKVTKKANTGPKEAKKPAVAKNAAKRANIGPRKAKQPAAAKKVAKNAKKQTKKGAIKVPAAKKVPTKKAATKVKKTANKKK